MYSILNGQLENLLTWYCLVALFELQVCKDTITVFLVLFNTIPCTLSINLLLTFYTQLSWLIFSL